MGEIHIGMHRTRTTINTFCTDPRAGEQREAEKARVAKAKMEAREANVGRARIQALPYVQIVVKRVTQWPNASYPKPWSERPRHRCCKNGYLSFNCSERPKPAHVVDEPGAEVEPAKHVMMLTSVGV